MDNANVGSLKIIVFYWEVTYLVASLFALEGKRNGMSFRLELREYLPKMGKIDSDICGKVMAGMNSYDNKKYTEE